MLKLEEKAKNNKINHGIEQKERKKRENTVKINENKQFLIKIITELLKNTNNISDLRVTNNQKLIEFSYNSKEYKIDLIEKRTKKE